jgi:hypothetical protein
MRPRQKRNQEDMQQSEFALHPPCTSKCGTTSVAGRGEEDARNLQAPLDGFFRAANTVQYSSQVQLQFMSLHLIPVISSDKKTTVLLNRFIHGGETRERNSE